MTQRWDYMAEFVEQAFGIDMARVIHTPALELDLFHAMQSAVRNTLEYTPPDGRFLEHTNTHDWKHPDDAEHDHFEVKDLHRHPIIGMRYPKYPVQDWHIERMFDDLIEQAHAYRACKDNHLDGQADQDQNMNDSIAFHRVSERVMVETLDTEALTNWRTVLKLLSYQGIEVGSLISCRGLTCTQPIQRLTACIIALKQHGSGSFPLYLSKKHIRKMTEGVIQADNITKFDSTRHVEVLEAVEQAPSCWTSDGDYWGARRFLWATNERTPVWEPMKSTLEPASLDGFETLINSHFPRKLNHIPGLETIAGFTNEVLRLGRLDYRWAVFATRTRISVAAASIPRGAFVGILPCHIQANDSGGHEHDFESLRKLCKYRRVCLPEGNIENVIGSPLSYMEEVGRDENVNVGLKWTFATVEQTSRRAFMFGIALRDIAPMERLRFAGWSRMIWESNNT